MLPLSVGDTDVRFDADLPPLAAVLSDEPPIGGEPRRVVFAARYRDCLAAVNPETERTIWTIRLRPDDAFLWTDPRTLAAVGLVDDGGPDDALRAVLARQAERVGVPPSVSGGVRD